MPSSLKPIANTLSHVIAALSPIKIEGERLLTLARSLVLCLALLPRLGLHPAMATDNGIYRA